MPKHQTTRERVCQLFCVGGSIRAPSDAQTKTGASRAKDLKRISFPLAPVSVCGGQSILVVLLIHNDSRQRISRLSHR